MKSIAFFLVAVALAVGGVLLARYAEADDAPGGVVMGWLLVGIAVVLGVKGLQHWRKSA